MFKFTYLLLLIILFQGYAYASDWVSDDVDTFNMYHKNQSLSAKSDYDSYNPSKTQNNSPNSIGSVGEPDENYFHNTFTDKNASKPIYTKQGGIFQLRANVNNNLGKTNLLNLPTLASASDKYNYNLNFPEKTRVGSSVFKAWLSSTHPDFFKIRTSITENQILNVKGAWDDASHVLHMIDVKHTNIQKRDLYGVNINTFPILIINCAGNISRDFLPEIQRYVYNGGYLLTTDWCLQNVIERCFPQYAQWSGDLSYSGLVDCESVCGDMVLMNNTVPQCFWYLEDKSQIIGYLNYDKVKVLVKSHELARVDSNHMGILAFTFDYGKGKVLHLVGHFDNNTNLPFRDELLDPAPKINISLRQAIALNFIIEALDKNMQK